MADTTAIQTGLPEAMTELFNQSAALTRQWLGQALPDGGGPLPDPADAAHWAGVAARMQALWLEFQGEAALKAAGAAAADPGQWLTMMAGWTRQFPLADGAAQQQLFADGMGLWQQALGQGAALMAGGLPGAAAVPAPQPPRPDRRFADPAWHSHPLFTVLHQSYLLFAEQMTGLVERMDGVDEPRKEQLRFATRSLVEALSPANLPATNPLVIERALETRGESLVKGLEHLLNDLRRGQLTHTDPEAFKLGVNIAITPGKVVHQAPLFELIQYSPATAQVGAVPLVIFPPWINRFYILDLNPKKSFVKWAVDQGITVLMVSWKSADASMAEVVWDDYVAAQLDAIDTVRARLAVPAVHAIGYCVAGTTLAATLALLARRGEADKVASATFFTAQVDFEKAGDLKIFIDEQQLGAIGQIGEVGFVDGRYLAATFNLLRGQDLIWNYVVNNYLLGQDYPAFDLLHWNGDTTNLPAKWHRSYLGDLYRDNLLVVPDRLSVLGTPIDLTRIKTPCYLQAGREDHIAPAESAWRLTRHLAGEWVFVLAGSGHIAGVVNPPAANKYQYWTNDGAADSFDAFVAGATETAGSWWPHWRAWLLKQDGARVAATGKRVPGGPGEAGLADAPGSYVTMR